MKSDENELVIFSFKDCSGRIRRLFFSSPTQTASEMKQEISLKTDSLASTGNSIDIICRSAEEIAAGYGAWRVPH